MLNFIHSFLNAIFCPLFKISSLEGHTASCKIMTQNTNRDWLKISMKQTKSTGGRRHQSHPIENLWHELKEFLRARVKPRNQEELIEGIKSFWGTVTPEKCCKYIGHLNKVIPKVIELHGDATGYQV